MAKDESSEESEQQDDPKAAGEGSGGEDVKDPLTRREAEAPRTSWGPDKDR